MKNENYCLDATLNLLAIIAKNEIHSAITYYFENYENLTSKAKIEWKLIKGIYSSKQIEQVPLNLHNDLKQRASGVALLFICSQFSRTEFQFFPELKKILYTPLIFKKNIAYAWQFNPQCTCLNNKKFRKLFAIWLAQSRESIGACLLAESMRNDFLPELIDELSLIWIKRGLSEINTPEHLSYAIKIQRLRDVCQRAVKQCFGFFWRKKGALTTLIQCAFDLEDYEAVVLYSELIISLEIDEDIQRKTLALRLAALAELDKEQEVIEEYRSRWLHENFNFPFPDRLLFIFQLNGQNDLEYHLLTNCIIDEDSPSWFKLNWQYINNEKREDLLKRWSNLYNSDLTNQKGRDLRILFGFTKFLISLPDSSRTECIEKVKKHWESLYKYRNLQDNEKPYEELAGAFLVLINKTKEEVIEAYRKYLLDKKLTHPMSKRAAQIYIRALAERKRWNELRDYLNKQDIHFIRAVSPFEEYEFIKTMANLENLPNNENHIITWCQCWERLIGLPLDSEMILQMVDHFINLSEKLIAESPFNINNFLLEDITLQILRRAKADAERLLLDLNLPDKDKKNISVNLQKADFNNTLEILRELIVYHQHEFQEVKKLIM